MTRGECDELNDLEYSFRRGIARSRGRLDIEEGMMIGKGLMMQKEGWLFECMTI